MLYGRFVVPWLARRQDRLIAVSRYTAGDITTSSTGARAVAGES